MPHPVRPHSQSSRTSGNGVLEVVEDIIKIKEEETAMVISCAKGMTASEKSDATVLAKKAETVAEAALKI